MTNLNVKSEIETVRVPSESTVALNRVYLFCFFLSGAAGLVYQIAWIRLLSIVFGNTTYAVSMVVAAFLTGLAIGSHYWGKRADKAGRPLDTYIKLEFLIGFSAIAITALIYLFDDAVVNAMTVESINSFGWQLLRYLIVFILLISPTLFMGGTAPLMAKIFVKSESTVGIGVGSVYAANTYGAMAGCFISGFLMVPLLGVHGTLLTAFFLNMAVAVMLLLTRTSGTPTKAVEKIAVKSNPVPNPAGTETPRTYGISPFMALSLFAVSGFCALAFEILWTRAFIVFFRPTVYMFSNLLTVFLFGMALGSHFASKWLDKLENPFKLFGFAQIGIGLLGILSVVFFHYSMDIVVWLGMLMGEIDWMKEIVIMLILVMTVFLIPTALMGLSYPLICRVTTQSIKSLGKNVGWVYAVGTAGGILGSLLAGFFILPLIGLQYGLFLVSVIAVINGFVALPTAELDKSSGWVQALSMVFVIIAFMALQLSGIDIGLGRKYAGNLLFAREGVLGTVKVTQKENNGPLQLWVNTYVLAGSDGRSIRFGHIPLLLKPDARDVLLISLGSGITAGSIGAHPVERIECVEIVPALLDVQPFFEKENHNIVADKRFKLTFWDGRHYVRVTKRRYDLIIADLFQPDSAGVGNLFSLEHFMEVKAKLKKGGAMAQWLPMYQLSPDNLKVIMRTFAQAFDHVVVWSGFVTSGMPTLMLLGSSEPIVVDPEKLASALKLKGVKEDMVEYSDPFSFLSFYVMDRNGLLEFTEGASINSDDNPVIEYTAPRNVWNREQYGPLNYQSLINKRQNAASLIPSALQDDSFRKTLDRYYDGRTKILEADMANQRGEYNKELKYYQEAAAIVPDDPIFSWSVFEAAQSYFRKGNRGMASELLKLHRR